MFRRVTEVDVMIVFVLCKFLPGYPDKEDASQEDPVWTADGAYI